MKGKMTLERALIIVRYAVLPVCCYPPPIGASTSVIRWHNFYLVFTMLHLPFAISAAAYNMYLHRHDIARLLKIMTQLVAMLSVLSKIIVCNIKASHFKVDSNSSTFQIYLESNRIQVEANISECQVSIAEMETFLKQATPEEKEVIQDYFDKLLVFNAIVFINAIIGPTMFIVAPLMTSLPYPGDVAYPFSVEETWVWALVYISQSIATVQVGSMMIMDITMGMILWYTGARFHILSVEFLRATTEHEVSRCAQKHQELLRCAERLMITVSTYAAVLSVFVIFLVGAVGLVIIGKPPIFELAKYVCFEIGGAAELFLLSWPADHLIEVSHGVGKAALSCDWIGKPLGMVQNLLIVSQRSRDPIVISVSGILPILSLEYYGSSVAASFSYLTTLRAMTME